MKSLNIILLPNPDQALTYTEKLDFFNEALKLLTQEPAIVALPMHAVFSENQSLKEPQLDTIVKEWADNVSRKHRKILIYTVLSPINDQYVIRTYVIYPNGQEAFYDQHHWMPTLMEPSLSRRGQKHLIIQVNQWKIMILTGEDLYFPEWVRMNQHEYHAILYFSDLNILIKDQILTLLSARAIENEVFIIAGLLKGEACERILVEPSGQIVYSNKDDDRVNYCLDQLKWGQLNAYTKYLPYKDGFVLLPPEEFLKTE